MNLIDNGIKEVLYIGKIISETEMYFEVTFIDWYGSKRTKRFSNINDLENKSWME